MVCGSWRACAWRVQRQHLVQGLLVGDQLRGDEFLAGAQQSRSIQRQQPRDGRIRVIAQALGIGHGDEEQVQRQGLRRTTRRCAYPEPGGDPPS